ncbi:C-C chemokine receptor type 3-like isoform X1 [Pygocentrus nattereri]|uniref:G-protein coupled receptors family 1 profile domain-containing protein n=1 Tax=Pygocentrus nattereri TaxID=42514 RepID=A0A3B4DTG6_PYGNA|nr:C-C chemokine receptor type 3-like isoform X1 [Pygocentrus nattereri]XP_037392692.1 C-C chemokine receptor type 3-like isoform X1 [Pygocentrus nattereri]
MENATSTLSSANYNFSSTLSWRTTSEMMRDSTTDVFSTLDYSGYYIDDLENHAPCKYGNHANNFLPVLYSLFFVVGFLGNVLVVWVILVGAQLKSMTDVCLLNLALADLLLVFTFPFLAHYANHDWSFGNAMCNIVLGIYYVGFYGGIFFIMLMSVDRYLAVVHAVFALRVRNKLCGILASVVIWIISVASSFPELGYLQIEKYRNEVLCSAYPNDDNSHYWKIVGLFKMNVLGLLIPLSIVGFCYSMVLRRLLTVRAGKKHAVRLVIVVVVVFFCCWTPYNIAAFLKGLELKKVIETNCESSKAILWSLQISEAVAYSHSCLNPFLYVFVGEKFKRHLIRLLRRTPCIKVKFMKDYLTQAAGSVYSQTTSLDERSTHI